MHGVTRLTKIIRNCAIAIGIGTLFPAIYPGAYYSSIVSMFPSWGIYLWPTSILLMMTDGREADYLFVTQVIAISLLTNALIWLIIGLLCTGLFGLMRRWVRAYR